MRRSLPAASLALLAAAAAAAPFPFAAADGDAPSARKENLDLPGAAFASVEDDSEPPEALLFYGQQYEGDSFFFCVDRSTSVPCPTRWSPEVQIAGALGSVSPFAEFGIVLFDQDARRFPATGAAERATADAKRRARTWLESIGRGHGSCPELGILEALAMANRARGRRAVVLYVGDGDSSCPGHDGATYLAAALERIAASNFRRHAIHAILVGDGALERSDHEATEAWARALAARNHGSFLDLRSVR